ncbi:glycosyltransferase [bacterium (Candidatus Blackallbacteria) CG17_big_fil_post_rev_8_21_14_2_50_48_46]|uniref:Glycosyltransferase n=1 Tax=bacterium (Candidatus Blackallbacteria) CG17_big_fil_post_rev_8_21_14_2_50_48_46 TaxID=2014261 RepID=A0A2M7G3X6_9BACT|nr:MAG: glycosyl transferase [bacterium (Candidatus Blackallbacteria) CG18_big_fil_WC_8_21_14_2_50_49_26]PIW16582.1 MAG: glycosyltransferase [bacterium (Candidatus Blackallbacteria) CG17_big_fil_post_rev_8_21_14_2_50_48_46]PIW46090.1 MAG: glycosyltransferase [bacterium (Candidatus Blackallbacteria) CG13_big_fil_rev_8_21_14_2_50_49_14]
MNTAVENSVLSQDETNTIPEVSLVAPMYNESEGLDKFFDTVIPILEQVGPEWEIVCVNDGSRDDTLEKLIAYHKRDPRIKVINFSRNFGKEAGTTAGIDLSRGKAVIPIDADLQDPPEMILAMIEKWREGYKVVLATRTERKEDTWFKRHSALMFYRLISAMSEVHIPKNTGDFRLMDRQVVDTLKQLPEKTRFMKGIFAWLGFPTTTIYFERPARFAGQTSWNYWKLWRFALDGIFAFTTLPLQVWTYLGAGISLLSFLYASLLVFQTLLHGNAVPGYASTMVAILFLGGIQLTSLGIIGEYVGRIYKEVKGRPIYIVENTYGFYTD